MSKQILRNEELLLRSAGRYWKLK